MKSHLMFEGELICLSMTDMKIHGLHTHFLRFLNVDSNNFRISVANQYSWEIQLPKCSKTKGKLHDVGQWSYSTSGQMLRILIYKCAMICEVLLGAGQCSDKYHVLVKMFTSFKGVMNFRMNDCSYIATASFVIFVTPMWVVYFNCTGTGS